MISKNKMLIRYHTLYSIRKKYVKFTTSTGSGYAEPYVNITPQDTYEWLVLLLSSPRTYMIFLLEARGK